MYRVELKFHSHSKFKSFKITLLKNYVLNESFWAHGLRCKKWNEPKNIYDDFFKNNKILSDFRTHN